MQLLYALQELFEVCPFMIIRQAEQKHEERFAPATCRSALVQRFSTCGKSASVRTQRYKSPGRP